MKTILALALVCSVSAYAHTTPSHNNSGSHPSSGGSHTSSAPSHTSSAPAQHYSAPAQHYSAPAQHYSAPARQSAPAASHQTYTPSTRTYATNSTPKTQPSTPRQSAPAQHTTPANSGNSNRNTYTPPARTAPAQQHTAPATGNANRQTTSTPNRQSQTVQPKQNTTPRNNNNVGNNNRQNNNPGQNRQTTQPKQNQVNNQARNQAHNQTVPQRPANMPKNVKLNAGDTVKAHPKDGGYTIRDSKGNTRVIDASGKQRASFNRNTGTSVYNRRDGGVTKTTVNQSGQRITTRTTKDGFKERVNLSTGARVVSYRGTTIRQGAVVNGRYTVSRSYTYGGRTIVNNYNYTRYYNNRWHSYYGVYAPGWYGGRWGYYDRFYGSAWFWAGYGFAVWAHPYYYAPNYWYTGYGWGWYGYSYYPYYATYWVPPTYYPNFGWYLASYSVAAALEANRIEREQEREAELADANARAAAAEYELANAQAINQQSVAIDNGTISTIANQQQAAMVAMKEQKQLDAATLMNTDHVFLVNETFESSVTVGDQTLQCKLRPGDTVQNQTGGDAHVDSVEDTDDDGNALKDPTTGETLSKNYVTLTVKTSNKGSCRPGVQVVVELSQLQKMADQELVDAEKGSVAGVEKGIHP